MLGCLLPLPNLFRLSTSHPALSSSSMLSGSTAGATLRTPHALNDSTAMNTSIGSAASPSSLNSATPADLISTLCKLMLRRSSPQPDSLRDGSSNGRLNEDAIENRLLSEVAASHRVFREVTFFMKLFDCLPFELVEISEGACFNFFFHGTCDESIINIRMFTRRILYHVLSVCRWSAY